MSGNTQYFEVFTEGDAPFILDISKYAQGRSGRDLPRSLAFTLLGYRYRPAAASCGLFPPRLVITANSFNGSGQIVVNEVGSRKTGAVCSLEARFSDSASSSVSSSVAGVSFNIDISETSGGLPTSIAISVADAAIKPQSIGFSNFIDTPVATPSDGTLKALMTNALIGKTYGTLNAVGIPIGLSKSFYTPSPSPLHVQMFGEAATEEHFIGSHLHDEHLIATASPPVNRDALVSRTPIYIARTPLSPIRWDIGGFGYAIVFGNPGSVWVADTLQKGTALSFFYRVHSQTGNLDSPLVIQRFDILVGDVVPPPERGVAANATYYPTTLVAESYRPFVSVFKIYVLPNTENLITPSTSTSSLITDCVVLPIERKEKATFAGTFSLEFVY